MPSLTGLEITAALLIGFAVLAAVAVWRRVAARPAPLRPVATPVVAAAAKPAEAGLRPMSAAEHWQRAANVLDVASERAAAMRQHQKAAAGHLDSADYALQQLVDELSQVMRVPSQPRVDNNVHQLKVGGSASPQAAKTKSAAAA